MLLARSPSAHWPARCAEVRSIVRRYQAKAQLLKSSEEASLLHCPAVA